MQQNRTHPRAGGARLRLAGAAVLTVAGCHAATHVRPFATGAPLPDLRGGVTRTVGSPTNNRCVPDVDGALSALSRTGRPFTVDLGAAPPLGRLTNHAQGVARLPGPAPVFVVSRSGAGTGALVASAAEHEAVPDGHAGVVIGSIASPADADHGGGIHTLGRLLFVPYEDKGSRALVSIYDLADPAAPRLVYTLDRTDGPFPHPANASNVAAARLQDGRFLVVVGAHSSRSLDFYVSNRHAPGDARFALTFFAALQREVPTSFQNTALLTQCDGTLFLAGTWNTRLPPPSGGRDLLAWYRLGTGAAGEPTLDEVGRAHLDCGRCNFAAGAGPYVDPSGAVRLYAVAHDDVDGAIVVEEFTPPQAGAGIAGSVTGR